MLLTLVNYMCVLLLQDADQLLVVSPQKPVDAHLSAFQSMEWIGTLPFKGHRCFDTDDYYYSSETNLDLFQFATSFYKGVKGVKQIVRFSPLSYPIVRGFGKDSGGQALITDLCHVPLRRMVVVVNPETYQHVYCFAVMAGGMFLFHLRKEQWHQQLQVPILEVIVKRRTLLTRRTLEGATALARLW